MIIKRKHFSMMQEALTGDMGLFDKKMMTGTSAKVGAGLNVGFAALAEGQHKKQLGENESQFKNSIKEEKNITAQLNKIAES